MYKIIAYENPMDKVGQVIFNPKFGKNISSGSKLTLKDSDIDDFSLTINQNNILFGKIKPFNTHIEVYDENKLLFRGRALKPKREMSQMGQLVQSAAFESISAYLLDSTQRFLEVHDTSPSDFFRKLIDVHNSQVPDYKKFKVGMVDVTNSTDNVYRYVDYTNTYDSIKEKLVDRLGGYLRVRYENGINYIDYLSSVGNTHSDISIMIGKNLKSSSVEIDPTSIVTRLIPLGATIERQGEDIVSNPRTTISSVNNGKDYIDILELQKEFGVINGTQVWDDVKEPSNLKTKGEQWIKDQQASLESWSISVVEVNNKYNVSDSYNFINPYVAENQNIKVIQKEIDFNNPQSPTLTIGQKKKSLSQYQRDFKKTEESITKLQNASKGQSDSIGALTTKTSKLRTDVDEQKTLIEQVNAKVDDIDLTQIDKKISSLDTQIKQVDSELLNYKNEQDEINEDVEMRLKKIEGGVDDDK